MTPEKGQTGPVGSMAGSASETLARRFHENYERLAPAFGYETRKASAVPWSDVPQRNKSLMIAVCQTLLDEGIPSSPNKQI